MTISDHSDLSSLRQLPDTITYVYQNIIPDDDVVAAFSQTDSNYLLGHFYHYVSSGLALRSIGHAPMMAEEKWRESLLKTYPRGMLEVEEC